MSSAKKTNTLSEFDDSADVTSGSTANHGMLGTVKVVSIRGDVAEVVDRFGKHSKVQITSLHAGKAVDEAIAPELSQEQFAHYVMHTYYVFGGNDETVIIIEDSHQKYSIEYQYGKVFVYPDEPSTQTRARAKQIKQEILTQADHGQFEPMDESVTENYHKHSAAAHNYDYEIENGDTSRLTYRDAAKHHQRAAQTADTDSLVKMHTKKAADYLQKSKSVSELSHDLQSRYIAKSNQRRATDTHSMHTSGKYDHDLVAKSERRAETVMKIKNKMVARSKNEAFPHDVDHMNGAIHRNADMATDNVYTKSKRDWDRAVDSINRKVCDDNSSYVTNSGGTKIECDGVVWARWDAVKQSGWFNAKARQLRPHRVSESVDAAVLQVGDPVIITGNVDGRGETGTFIDAGVDGKFIVVRLHSDGSKHSYHSSDVEYYEHNDYDEDDYEEESMTESTHDQAVAWFKATKPAKCDKCSSSEFFRTSNANTQQVKCAQCGKIAASKKFVKESVLSEALNEWGIDSERHAEHDWATSPARGMASNRTGKYCLTRDNPPVRGKGFLCFGKEGEAVDAWKRLTNNAGVKIVRESAFAADGTPLKEGEVLLIDPSTLTESRYDGQGYGRERWDTNTQGYQDREQGRIDQTRRDFKRDEMEHELGHERNNYAVNIDGRQWKVFASQQEAKRVASRLLNKYPGKKTSVHLTGAAISEAIGDDYASQLASQLPPGLVDEDDILDQAFVIAKQQLGPKRARHWFAYDEDFPSDLISAYFTNERAGGVHEAAGDKKSTTAPAPRNFVAKNAKMGGAGQHKDMKRAVKQGDFKHKGKLDEQALAEADLAALKERTK